MCIRDRCNIKEQTLYIEVEHRGRGIADVQKAMEPFFTTKPEMDRSGMGFSFMEAFMDQDVYKRQRHNLPELNIMNDDATINEQEFRLG